MRIAGGVIFLLIGIWSLLGGACTAFVGGATTAVVGAAGDASGKVAKNMTPEQKKQWEKAMKDIKKAGGGKAATAATGALVGGIISLIAGILCIIAGIMFFLNKGKMLGFIAAGVGILGEVVFIAMVTFSIILVIKILLYAFAGFAGTKVGQAA